ncbi:MAG TPA: TMEM175 family protein [Pyrinomonadaceae bacterium]|jgi:uncharacterized membrane protein
MIRDKLLKMDAAANKGFRLRGVGEIGRIEAFSDAVLAFAVTLLIVSLEVPKTFTELMEMMRGFIAFAITFAMLFHVWFEQYKFFRRYGLQDNFTVWINGLLLFVVLFYVYPLKFVWNLAFSSFTGHGTIRGANGEVEPIITNEQVPAVMIIFGIGFTAVFLIFVLLYFHAYRKRSALELNELEIYDTRTQMQDYSLNVAIGVLSIAVALFGGRKFIPLSMLAYWLIGPVQTVHGIIMGRRRRRLEKTSEEGSPEAA